MERSLTNYGTAFVFNLSEISWIILMLYGTSIVTGIDTKFFWYFNITSTQYQYETSQLVVQTLLINSNYWKQLKSTFKRFFSGDTMKNEPYDIQTDGKRAKILYFIVQFRELECTNVKLKESAF